MEVLIYTGTYNTKDYRVIKRYKNHNKALKRAQSFGYPYSELFSTTWTCGGKKITISIN